MAEDEGRASRIAELKSQHPRLTWNKIAAHVGVTERSAIKWQKTGALETENAEKLAELFGVDFDYLWFGPRPDTPEMFVDRRNGPKTPVAVDRLDGELADRISAIETTLNDITSLLEAARSERDQIRELLARQDGILQRIENTIRSEEDVRQLLDASVETAERASRETVRLLEELQAAPPRPAAARKTTAK